MVFIFEAVNITWRDLLDIFIVTALCYQISIFVKGTRALTVILGLGLLFLLFLFSRAVGLYTVSWMLQHIFGSLFLVVIILFQRDIRLALGGMGTSSFWRRPAIKQDMLLSIVNACEHMSRVKTGALIVIERSMPLGDTLSNAGVRMDSLISYELILSIFNTKCPLHDGAVIISHGRIMAAACILPLAVVHHLQFGTRHRAAIGITEESDAVVIVISEERGEISLAIRGNLARNIEISELLQVLRDVV